MAIGLCEHEELPLEVETVKVADEGEWFPWLQGEPRAASFVVFTRRCRKCPAWTSSLEPWLPPALPPWAVVT